MTPTIYWLESPWPGRLGIMPRPRGGDWLPDEVRGWGRLGVDVVVSLLTPEEVEELSLNQESELTHGEGMEFVAFPIEDRDIPSSRKAARELIEKLAHLLEAGKSVVIHCRQGVGRAGMIASSILTLHGEGVEAVLQSVSAARRCAVPETPEQRRWIEEFARARQERVPTE